jgi:hypothetical protein
MFSARTTYGEIFDDEAFRLFCSIAASGEAQSGWENGKIAELVPGSQAGLPAKIAQHGADEDKHGRIFAALLRKRGLEPAAVPPDADYTTRLEAGAAGHAQFIGQTLRTTALAEIAVQRDVSLAVMAHLGQILGWPPPKAAVLAAGIRAVYARERLGGRRRMAWLRMPARRDALGGRVPTQPSRV